MAGNDKIIEARRAGFEHWAVTHNANLKEDDIDGPEEIRLDRQGGVYIWANAESAWFAWNAALDSLCVDLPFKVSDDNDYDDGYVQAIEDCRSAIHAAGVKTK